MTNLPLRGRAAIVTGGAHGIGKATCLALARAGAELGIIDRDIAAAEAVAREIETAFKVRAVAAGGDVADEAEVREAKKTVSHALGHVTVLVNNAGIMPQENVPIDAQGIGNFDQMMAVHVRGTVLMSSACLADMRAEGFGRIVNLSSIFGILGSAGRLGYHTAKTALVGVTRALAMENARHGITVNAVAPGFVLTETLAKRAEAGILDTQSVEARTPVGRWAQPDEIARLITFLADPGSSYITGTLIPIDGGYTISGEMGN